MLNFPRSILFAVCASALLVTLPGFASGDTEVWRLDLVSESGDVGPEAFPAWMESNGFKPFSYLLFKRRPEYWRIGPCDGVSQPCLVMQEKDSSSHIIYPFEPGVAVGDTLAVELAYRVKLQAQGAQLNQKDKEDAPLRIFLSFRTKDDLLHLALTDSAAHAAGTVAKSERKPDNIRYYMLPDRSEADGYQTASFPVKTIFQQAFGPGDPGELVAIGIKSDSNNLGGESLTYLKTLRLVR
ncbi:MAG: DUF3047 domain-containing protein [Thiotrichales bacterium]|nr:MAG: DUF3047 domain-containing protein [Thiotrichales bacterium]